MITAVEQQAEPVRQVRGAPVVALFALTSFLGSTLLFLIEPMVTKMLLPLLGGTPAVWNTAMVFFQTALLGGYLFAHLSLRGLGVRRQPVLQVVCLLAPLVLLPVAVPDGWHPDPGSSPMWWTLAALTLMVGAPFFMLSTAGPTLQRWFSETSHPRAADPYFLYAAGNVGSLLGLLAYPIIVEPVLTLTQQSRLWAAGYAAFVLCTVGCAVVLRADLRRRGAAGIEPEPAAGATDLATDVTGIEDAPPIPWRTRGRWVFLAAIPSALLLGVTRHIGSDVAAMPLLWVIPLSLYLITFIVAFGRRPDRPVQVSGRILKLLVIPLAVSFYGLVASLWLVLALHLTVFFCAAMVAHGRLSEERPPSARLTEFYLLLSLGGVVGGILTSLLAPVVFDTVLEYPIAIVLALVVLPASAFEVRVRGERTSTLSIGDRQVEVRTLVLAVAVVVLAIASVVVRARGDQSALVLSIIIAGVTAAGAYVLARRPIAFAATIGALLLVAIVVPANPTIHQERTFFGVHRVYEDQGASQRHVLLNGTTVHGMEDEQGAHAGQPTTYYHRTGPIGQFFESRADAPPAQVAMVGLGSGALAAYGRPGDRFTYYEIDQAVIDIADDPNLFTFVHDSQAHVDFRVGDGRLELERTPDRYDVIVVDAFSGDAIPIHLITEEALGLYQRRLGDHGVIAFHISNRYFDLEPVLARLAHETGLRGWVEHDVATPEQTDQGKLDATWVLLARDQADLGPLANDERWVPLGDGAGAPRWTDDYSDLLHVFRWGG